MPGLIHLKRALALIPDLETVDLRAAIEIAGKSLTPEAESEAVDALNGHFACYCQDRIWRAPTVNLLSSDLAKELKRLSKKADLLLEMISNDSPCANSLAASLELQAILMAEQSDGHESSDWRDATFRGGEKFSQVLESLRLFAKLSAAAFEYERSKVEAGKSENTNVGDPEINQLLKIVGIFWQQTFQAEAAISWSEHDDSPTGKYLQFVRSLLHSFAARIPKELDEDIVPGLRDSLRLSDNAIRTRVRAIRKK